MITMKDVEDKLDIIVAKGLDDHAEFIRDQGGTQEEIEASLITWKPMLMKWRAETLAELMRFAIEPTAPSHKVQ